MPARPSIFDEPMVLLRRIYRLWRECRRIERERGVSAAKMAIVFYGRIGEIFDDEARDDDHAAAAGTQPIALDTTTPPPIYVPRC